MTDPESPPLHPIVELAGKAERAETMLKELRSEIMAIRDDQAKILSEALRMLKSANVIGGSAWQYQTVCTNEAILELARALSYDKPQSKHLKVALQRITDIVSKQGAPK